MSAPWLAALRERIEECYAAPTLSRDEALALLDIADAAADVTAGDPQWWANHPLGRALERVAA